MTKFKNLWLEPHSALNIPSKPVALLHSNDMIEEKEREANNKSTKEEYKARLNVTIENFEES